MSLVIRPTIWILNHYAVTPDLPGGTRHYDFGLELTKRGYHVTIFASNIIHKSGHGVQIDRRAKYLLDIRNGLHFVWIKTFAYQSNNWRRAVNLIAFALRAYVIGRQNKKLSLPAPRIIIGSSVDLLTVLTAYFLAKKHHAKFIMEIRDLWPQSLIDIGALSPTSLTAKLLRILEKFLYRQADRIIILSPLTREYLTALNIPDDRICLIPNGVDLGRYPLTESAARDRPDRFTVLYTGSINLVNALDSILEAAGIVQSRKYPRITFKIIGSGDQKNALIQKSTALKLKNVIFDEPVPKNDLPALLRTADVLLLSENKILYGSSNKLNDYLAAAKPIVFSTYAPHNIFDDINCGISVPPRDPEKLAQAVINLSERSVEDLKLMGRNGRQYARQHRQIPQLVDKLITLF